MSEERDEDQEPLGGQRSLHWAGVRWLFPAKGTICTKALRANNQNKTQQPEEKKKRAKPWQNNLEHSTKSKSHTLSEKRNWTSTLSVYIYLITNNIDVSLYSFSL